MHLQAVQTGYPHECDPDAPEDTRKRLSKRYVAFTTASQRRGTYKVVDLVSDEQRATLAAWANDYESRRTYGINLVWESVHGVVQP